MVRLLQYLFAQSRLIDNFAMMLIVRDVKARKDSEINKKT